MHTPQVLPKLEKQMLPLPHPNSMCTLLLKHCSLKSSATMHATTLQVLPELVKADASAAASQQQPSANAAHAAALAAAQRDCAEAPKFLAEAFMKLLDRHQPFLALEVGVA